LSRLRDDRGGAVGGKRNDCGSGDGGARRLAGSGGRNGSGDGRADAGEDRSGAVFDEPVEWAHGIRHCGSGAAARSTRAAGKRTDWDSRSGRGGTDAGGDSGRDAGGGFEIAAPKYSGNQDSGSGGLPAESGGGAKD